MKFAWILVAGLMFSGSVFADDDKPKAEEKPVEAKAEAKVESSAVSTVTVVVMDDDGKVIKKSTTSKTSEGGPQKVHVQVIDGKRVIEITAPDGTKKTINVGAAVASGDAVDRVMSWAFKTDKDGELSEVKEVQEQIAKVLKDLDVNVTVDAEMIADQVKAAIIQVRPAVEMAKEVTGELAGEVLVEIGESAFIVESGQPEGEGKEDGKLRRPLQIRRIAAAGAGMPELMKKLEEITQRLEKIESRLDKIEQK